jgi:hypothetical protein
MLLKTHPGAAWLLLLGLLAAGGSLSLSRHRPVAFDNPRQFRSWALARGLTVWPRVGPNFWVSRDPARQGAAPSPLRPEEWEGIVVVGSAWDLLEVPGDLPYQRWGGVTAYGCGKFLDQLDDLR